MKSKKIITIILIIFLIVIAVLVFNKPEKLSEQKNINVGILKHESTLPFYVAEELNYFEKAGVSVKLIDLPPGDHMPALLSDRVDIISPTSFTVLFGVMENNPNLLFSVFPGAEILNYQTVYGIVVRNDFKGIDIYSLKNKSIVAINPFTKVNIQNILAASGIPKEEWPKILVADREGALSAVINKKAESAILDQPSLAIALQTNDLKLLESNPRAKYIGSPYWSGSGAVKIDTWNSEKEELLKVMEAIDSSVIFIRNHNEEAHIILAKKLGIDTIVANQMGGYYFPLTTDTIEISGIKKTVKSLLDAGLLEKGINMDKFFPNNLYNVK